MRNYELMTILHPDLDTEAHDAALKKIEKLIADNGGQVESIEPWGKKRLAYEINHIKDGNYTIINFSGAPETIKEMDRVLKINDEVVRFMIVKKPDVKP
jgi:small subunit ribosomal protein S6